MVRATFNIRRAGQVAAYFAQADGGSVNVLKLMKLVYLADRESMSRFESPILFDHMVSMAHGPVNSGMLDLVNGMVPDSADWSGFVGARRDNDVCAAGVFEDGAFDELSRRDLLVLAAVWQQFGGMDRYALRDWTHDHCPEWEDPHGSSNPIPYARIFKFLNKPDADRLADEVESDRILSALLELNELEFVEMGAG